MAIGPATNWYIRTDGNDANGGGFDSTISGAGTNYCDQASPELSLSDIVTTGTTTVTSVTGGFTSQMIANAIQIGGDNYYFITAVGSTNSITVDRNTGTGTGQTGKVGGAFRNPSNLSNGGSVTPPAQPTPLIAGNTVNLRGSGSGSVGSPDYPQSGFAEYPSGNAANGYITWVGYNSTPYFTGNGLSFYSISYHKFIDVYIAVNGNNYASDGIILGQANVLLNCVVDANNQSGMCGLDTFTGNIIGGEIKGSGTLSGDGVNLSQYVSILQGVSVHGWGGIGINAPSNGDGIILLNSLVYANGGIGVLLGSYSSNYSLSIITGNTIDNNGGDGIQINGTATYNPCIASQIINNTITNNAGYGINADISSGSTATNDQAVILADYNNVYNNTAGNYNNISAGAHDISVNPGYANASAGNYTPSNTALDVAFPTSFP